MFANTPTEIDQKLARHDRAPLPTRHTITATQYLAAQGARKLAERRTMKAYRAERSRKALAALILGLSQGLARLARRIEPQAAAHPALGA